MKSIPNFPNYLISPDGYIYSKCRKREKAVCNGPHGYKIVQLWKNNKPFMKSVHRLVLETFVGPCPKGMEACHINGDNQNNHIYNLRWDTPSKNHKDSVLQGTHTGLRGGEDAGNSKLTNKQVNEIRKLYSKGNILQRELAVIYNTCPENICMIVNYKTFKI